MARYTTSGGGAGSDTTAIHDDTGGEIAAVTAKATPVAADVILIEDSAASNAKKSVTTAALVRFPRTPPDPADYSTAIASMAAGTASSDGAALFTIAHGGGAYTLRGRLKAISISTSLEFKAGVSCTSPGLDAGMGLVLYESGSGKLYNWSINRDGFISMYRWANTTTPGAAVVNLQMAERPAFIGVTLRGSDCDFLLGTNRGDSVIAATESWASHFGTDTPPTHFGFGGWALNTYDAILSVSDLVETAT